MPEAAPILNCALPSMSSAPMVQTKSIFYKTSLFMRSKELAQKNCSRTARAEEAALPVRLHTCACALECGALRHGVLHDAPEAIGLLVPAPLTVVNEGF